MVVDDPAGEGLILGTLDQQRPGHVGDVFHLPQAALVIDQQANLLPGLDVAKAPGLLVQSRDLVDRGR